MSSVLRFLVVAILLASCGGREYSAPRNLDDACALSRERPAYMRAMRDTERRWSVPVPVQMAIIHAESRFRGDARTPHRYALGVIPMGRQSSAYGYSQALDGTWEEYQEQTRSRRARRDDIDDATDFIGWYARESYERNNILPTDARNLYLAYHEGQAGYRRGSYNGKPWLVALSSRVAQRAQMYDEQLRSCGRR
ncbi:lytic transglycosylase [Pararhodobacter oceanensis]|uniref:Lytic transglycosylase n=1 Tax=Pararhodobacter oceanensis TaxID=2172121 RepID=A0A2T8HRC2_9RHOB|nr:lytic transglycosylase [Pararhodobacter oceanensis]PVH27892.1 lytic transglycosylase [Pararhodobacter oceanensis]